MEFALEIEAGPAAGAPPARSPCSELLLERARSGAILAGSSRPAWAGSLILSLLRR